MNDDGYSAWLERLEDKPNKRCRRWLLRVRMPKRSGERERVSRKFDGAYREAQAALAGFLEECKGGAAVRRSPLTLDEWGARWNAQRLRGSVQERPVSKRTHDKAAGMLKAVGMHIGGMRVQDIDAAAVLGAYDALARGETPSGKPWSSTTLQTLHNVLSGCLRGAVDAGIIAESPMSRVKTPPSDTKERAALRVEEAVDLMSKMGASDWHCFAVSLYIMTGLRSEELLSVEMRDVGEWGIHVRREVTKTDAGERTVPLDEEARMLIDLRMMIVADRMAQRLGCGPGPSTCLVCDDLGNPVTYTAMRRWWARHRADYGLEGFTLHQFRHTFASIAAQAMAQPKTIQKLMGHKDERVALRIYTHVHDEQKVEAVNAMAELRAKAASKVAPGKHFAQ